MSDINNEETKNKLFAEYPDVVTVEEMKQMLQLGRTTAYKLIKNKTIPTIKIGKSYRIQKADIIEFMAKK